MKIDYTSPNGYRGVLYGKSSMRIYDPEGNEIVHTSSRIPNTSEELKEVVEKMPELNKTLDESWDKLMNSGEITAIYDLK